MQITDYKKRDIQSSCKIKTSTAKINPITQPASVYYSDFCYVKGDIEDIKHSF